MAKRACPLAWKSSEKKRSKPPVAATRPCAARRSSSTTCFIGDPATYTSGLLTTRPKLRYRFRCGCSSPSAPSPCSSRRSNGCRLFILGQHSHDSHVPAAAAFDFHWQGNQPGAGRRNLVEVGYVLDHVDTRPIQELMSDEILRRPMVQSRRVDAHAIDLMGLYNEIGCFPGNPGKMQIGGISRLVGSEIALLVRPELTPACAYQQDDA